MSLPEQSRNRRASGKRIEPSPGRETPKSLIGYLLRAMPSIRNDNVLESANRRDPELLADFTSEAIIDFVMPRHRSLRAIHEKMVCAGAFAGRDASMLAQVVQQFVPFHLRAVPA
jgi:hypothetical protein